MTRPSLAVCSRHVALLWAALVLSACSAVSIGYGNAPTLLSWRAAEYFDLDADQRMLFRERLRAVHEWHRREQLPQLLATLEEAGRRIDRPVTLDDAEWLVGNVRTHYRAIVARIIDSTADILGALSPEQIVALESRLAEKGAEFAEEWIDAPPERVREARYERVLAHAEAWMGRLDQGQRAWLQERLDAIPVDYRSWRADRERREAELLALLRRMGDEVQPVSLASPHAAQLRGWALDWDERRTPAQREQVERLRREYMRLGVDLVNRATPGQRERIKSRLDSYLSGLSRQLS